MSSQRDNNITCNGKSPGPSYSVPKVKVPVITSDMMSETQNLDWLLHLMYVRQDFPYCISLIEHHLKQDCNHDYSYFIKGLIAKDEEHYQDAVKNIQIAIEMNPTKTHYYIQVGKILSKMGKLKQALEVFLKAESLQEGPDYEIYYNIGELLNKNAGRPKMGAKEAKEYFQKAIQHGKQDVESYRKLAAIYLREKEYQKAIDMLESALM